MTVPVVPVPPVIDQEDALSALLVSIALEEVALAHLINAEAEKVQTVVLDPDTDIDDVIEVQETVVDVMRLVIKQTILLQFKLEDVLEFKELIEFTPEPEG